MKKDYLDQVFAGRNKEYGAYSLRLLYPCYLKKAFFMASLLFGMVIYSVKWMGKRTNERIEEKIICMCGFPKTEWNFSTVTIPKKARFRKIRSTIGFVPPLVHHDSINFIDFLPVRPKKTKKKPLFSLDFLYSSPPALNEGIEELLLFDQQQDSILMRNPEAPGETIPDFFHVPWPQ